MLKTAKTYMTAWQAELGTGPKESLVDTLKKVSAPSGIVYKADGVVHMEDRTKSPEELADHIQERHRAYKHVVHDVFCSAADEGTNSVFMGVRFIMQSVGPIAGQEPSGWPSQGVLIERLILDDENHIKEALVCRQLTREETGALTVDPSAVKLPDVDDSKLYAPEEQLSAEDTKAMGSVIDQWVHCWDSDANLEVLEKVLSPDVEQLSGYGLAHNAVPFKGIQGAYKAIQGALKSVENKNTLISTAVCNDRRAAFVHWQANMMPPGAKSPETIQALDYIRFSPDNKIAMIWNFTMKPYKNVRDDAPRTAGVD